MIARFLRVPARGPRSVASPAVLVANSSRRLTLALVALGVAATVGCSESSTEPEGEPVASVTTLQVNAATNTAYVQLGDTIRQVTPSDPSASTGWDLAVFATSVALNSGAGGPGSVTGYCLCANAGISNTAIQSLTAESELAAFDAVTTAQIPAAGLFTGETLNARITGWFTGTGAASQANPASTFVVLRTRVLPIPQYGKFHVTNITGATATSPGTVTFAYAMQATSGGVLPAAQTATITVGSTPVYFDLVAGAPSTASGTWDIQFDGFLIRANSGASGGAGVLVAPPIDAPFASLDLNALYALPNSGFGQDALGGPLGANPWYKYNVTGSDMQIWPNFNVYLIMKGSAVYKVQLTSYYSSTGESRVISMRSERLQ